MVSYNFIKTNSYQGYKKFIKEIFLLISHMEKEYYLYIKMETYNKN